MGIIRVKAEIFTLILLAIKIFIKGQSIPCAARQFDQDSVVCVCNSTYCDSIDRVPPINEGEFVMLVSSREGLRFKKTVGKFAAKKMSSGHSWLVGPTSFFVDSSKTYQKMIGFGSSLTDAAGINIMSLNEETREQLLKSYFSEEGVEYNVARLPISGTDFSIRAYTYDDGPPDPQLEHFSLAEEDFKYKIPILKQIRKLSSREVYIVGASWCPPIWMKTNGMFYGYAFLKKEYYDAYAKYLIRFLEEYKKQDLSLWGISSGNEPMNGILTLVHFNSLGWTPSKLADWIVNYFGPQLRDSPYKDIKLLTYDDQRIYLPRWINNIVKANQDVLRYVDGFSVHYYTDFLKSEKVILDVHNTYPNKFILYTEASTGYLPWERKVELGSWRRGEQYFQDILQNMSVWVSGWLDWNMALDVEGGPSWADNRVDSPIIINAGAGEFYKQPMYYAMAHVAKYIERDAVRIAISPYNSGGVVATAVLNPDGRIVIVMFNKDNKEKDVALHIQQKSGWINVTLPARSFITILC